MWDCPIDSEMVVSIAAGCRLAVLVVWARVLERIRVGLSRAMYQVLPAAH